MPSERSAERLVLVVDDDPDILQTLALCLSTEGYRVLMAANGREALDLLSRERPACILLDLMMPVMNGFEFLERKKQEPALAGIPVVVITAHARPVDVSADGFLTKPLSIDRLLSIIGRYCAPPAP